ncbi:glycoside hydrolase family 61 protein [Microthyrium microscopicum]|uniref:AA9 family lytic polysaccharide monooxygenase n=1 Tax=Microthyrium microscopicum TaxID=703497 RepID=A0A6A6TYA2_9PEZI|nr:glycoside hydrolase family 61 protein [Microthyrium microscopicum]
MFFLQLWLAGAVSAHTIFQEVKVNGVSQGHKVGVRYPTYDGPIYDVTSPDIICNGGPNPLLKPFSKAVINVKAGDTVSMMWHHTLDGRVKSDKSDPIDISHLGPTLGYMAKVANATSENVSGLQWFKVHEDGLDAAGKWGVQRMYQKEGEVSFKVPTCIENGNYLLRGELIALHGAQNLKGAQIYMECAQINVLGGTGSKKPSTVPFPGAYKQADPGIKFNLYGPKPLKYTIPGPPVFKC